MQWQPTKPRADSMNRQSRHILGKTDQGKESYSK